MATVHFKSGRAPKWFKISRCDETGKIRHRTEAGALAHAERLYRSRSSDGRKRGVYPCPSCRQWHVGGDD